jgi:catechol 2,3-dioxygenase-like lactoylglutathione lyase family enzyme
MIKISAHFLTGLLLAMPFSPLFAAPDDVTAPVSLGSHIKGIHHYALSVEKVDDIARWYSDTLGFRVERDFGFPEMGIRIVHLIHPAGIRLELLHDVKSIPGPDGGKDAFGAIATRGSKHLGFTVDDVAKVAQHMKAQGVPVLHDVTRVDIAGVTNFWILDPEGNHIEFVQPLAAP